MHDGSAYGLADSPVLPAGIEVARETWSGLIDCLPVGVYLCDRSGLLLRYNPCAAELWGHTPDLGVDAPLFSGAWRTCRADGQLLPQTEDPMCEALRTARPVRDREICVQRPDGSRIVVLVNATPLFDVQGSLTGGVSSFQDVTGLHRERAEARNEKKLQDIVEALPAAVYTTDAAGRVTFYNRAAVALSGREPTLGSDKWCVTWRLRHPDGRLMPHDECPMAIALRENRPMRGAEAIAEREDGTQIPFVAFPTPLHDESGRLIGAVNMLVDVSERRRSEARHKVLLNELNHRVKNNMQMMHSLLAIAQREAVSAEARASLSEAAQRVAAMAAAQQVLYDSDDAVNVDAGRFLAAVCANARHALGRDIEVKVGPEVENMPNDRAIPLALILNELLTCASTGVRPDAANGPLRVRLSREDGMVVLAVEEDVLTFRIEKSVNRSSGFGLVSGLARQLGGSVQASAFPRPRCAVRIPDLHPVS